MSVRYVSSVVNNEDDQYRVKKHYMNLRSNVNVTINRLRAAINYLDNIKSDFTNYYSVDAMEADSNKIDISKRELEQRVKYLTERVVPEINRQINKLSS